MNSDNFKEKARNWDKNSLVVNNAKSIADAICLNIPLHKEMEIMDFGAGTGLLSSCISGYIKKIVAIDSSLAMLEKFKEKSSELDCEIELMQKKLPIDKIENRFDGIISSMTLHHIEDIKELFNDFYNYLKDDGFIALADLQREDGTFHSDNEGVFHFGFDTKEIESIAKEVGFKDIKIEETHIIEKPEQSYMVFLITAIK